MPSYGTSQADSPNVQARMTIPSTDYATSYRCRLTDTSNGVLKSEDLDLLAHVNCTYLSSGMPPTMLALKQHAQSLAILIRKLSISTAFGIVDGDGNAKNSGKTLRFEENEAFDWLNDLSTPYQNEDEMHHVPLWAIANQISGESEVRGLDFHCPLKTKVDFGPLAEKDGVRKPFETHHNLLMHANTCLEIIDHEYSATGGLLSILPTDEAHDTEQMAGVRNTLIGQWLLHHQHLVARTHELETSYANSIDLTAGEAVVPLQMKLGESARGREVAYPQDRFVLAHISDEVFTLIHRLMDEHETDMQEIEEKWQERGVSGDKMWTDKTSRGLVPLDLVSRFYRIKGAGNPSPLFILPAIEKHPGLVTTREIEKQPMVVAVSKPRWPERVSEWEQQHKKELDKVSMLELKNLQLEKDVKNLRMGVDTMSKDQAALRSLLDEYKKAG